MNRECLNCGTPLLDKYCHHCGQKDIARRQGLRELIENFLGSFFSFESKFFRTTRYLLFRPGFLANEYNSGHRESYYHPARMYVFISFVYFLLSYYLPGGEVQTAPEDSNRTYHSSSGITTIDLGDATFGTKEEYDSAQLSLPETERDGWFMRKMNYRVIELEKKYSDTGRSFGGEFDAALRANLSKVFFVLLPIAALILRLLYFRRDYFYTEHLVSSIFVYNFLFIMGIVNLLVRLIPGMSWFSLLALLISLVYWLIFMKRVYRQGWPKTVMKYVLFIFGFTLCGVLAMATNLLITFMII